MKQVVHHHRKGAHNGLRIQITGSDLRVWAPEPGPEWRPETGKQNLVMDRFSKGRLSKPSELIIDTQAYPTYTHTCD